MRRFLPFLLALASMFCFLVAFAGSVDWVTVHNAAAWTLAGFVLGMASVAAHFLPA